MPVEAYAVNFSKRIRSSLHACRYIHPRNRAFPINKIARLALKHGRIVRWSKSPSGDQSYKFMRFPLASPFLYKESLRPQCSSNLLQEINAPLSEPFR